MASPFPARGALAPETPNDFSRPAVASQNSSTYKHPNIQTQEYIIGNVRWNIAVSPDVDQSVRMFLAAQGGGRKGDLSRFIEEAVRAYLLESDVVQAKSAAAGLSETELTDLIDEAVEWAREH